MSEIDEVDQQNEKVKSLVSNLSLKDGMKRKHARVALERLGKRSTPLLLEALQSDNDNVRWEVVKALQMIRDPDAVSALIRRLHDPVFEVRWLAAEALIQLGYDQVTLPLLEELKQDIKSEFIRNAVHHVLRIFKEKGGMSAKIEEVLKDIWSMEPEPAFYEAVAHAINHIKQTKEKL